MEPSPVTLVELSSDEQKPEKGNYGAKKEEIVNWMALSRNFVHLVDTTDASGWQKFIDCIHNMTHMLNVEVFFYNFLKKKYSPSVSGCMMHLRDPFGRVHKCMSWCEARLQ